MSRQSELSLNLSLARLQSLVHTGHMATTSFAPRPSIALSMPGTPRNNGSTPRSARRLQSTPSSRLSFGGNALALAQASALAPLPPINSRVYPDKSYADDDELRDLIERDKVAVDDAVQILGHALAHTRKRLVESLEEIAAEHRRLERLTRELGDAAKDMVKTVQREKDEMDKARQLENEVQTRSRSLAVQVEAATGEVKEIHAKLHARRDRESPPPPPPSPAARQFADLLLPRQSKRDSAPRSASRSHGTDPNSRSSNGNSASRSAEPLVSLAS